MIPPSDINDIEQLHERHIIAERNLAGKIRLIDQHVKIKYACACKICGVKTALIPLQPLPASQASALIRVYTMMTSLLVCPRLYRQEKMRAR